MKKQKLVKHTQFDYQEVFLLCCGGPVFLLCFWAKFQKIENPKNRKIGPKQVKISPILMKLSQIF